MLRIIAALAALSTSIIVTGVELAVVPTAFTESFFPSPTDGYMNIGNTAISVAAFLYGSRVGELVRAIGPLIADLIIGYSRWSLR